MISVRFFFIFIWYSVESFISRDCVSNVSLVEVELVVSRVNVMFIFDVVIKFIEILCRVRMSKIFVRKLWECSIFRLCKVSRVWLRWSVRVWNSGGFLVLLYISVLFVCGFLLESIKIGISLCIVGSNVVGCSIFVLKVVIFVVSVNVILSMCFVVEIMCGSVV